MKSINIQAKKREAVGRKQTAKLREEGNVPCVIYGGDEVIHFYAHENELRHLVYTPNAYIVKLSIDGKELDAILQDIQFHPVTDKILHIDFMQAFEGKPVTVNIPVKLHGLAAGVKQGGKLNLLQRKLRIKGLMKDLPDTLDVNVESVTLGKTVKVGELSFDNLQILNPKSEVVLSVKLTRAAVSEEEEEELEEGEEAEGEAGEDEKEAASEE